VPTCRFPYDLYATNLTQSGADFGWTERDSATVWDLEIVAFGLPPTGIPTVSGITSNPYTWTDGMDGTAYDFYVRAVCGEDDESKWAGPYAFITHCSDPISTFPYEEAFESTWWLPVCWKSISVGEGNNSWVILPDTHSDDLVIECGYAEAEQEEWLISPEFDFTNLLNPQISFDWKMSYYWMVYPYNKGDLKCRVSTDGGNNWSEPVWSDEMIPQFETFVWFNNLINLSAYSGLPSVSIGFEYTGNDAGTVYLDNFMLMDGPVGVENPDLNNTGIAMLYPNPTKNSVYIDYLSTKPNQITAGIFDLVGYPVENYFFNTTSGNNLFQLDLSDLPAGVYLLVIRDGKRISSERILRL